MSLVTITIAACCIDADGVCGIPKRDKAIYDVGSIVDAGNDVEFVDYDSNDAEVNYINVSKKTFLKYRPIQYTDDEAKIVCLEGGKWDKILGIHKIFADGTSKNSNIMAKIGN